MKRNKGTSDKKDVDKDVDNVTEQIQPQKGDKKAKKAKAAGKQAAGKPKKAVKTGCTVVMKPPPNLKDTKIVVSIGEQKPDSKEVAEEKATRGIDEAGNVVATPTTDPETMTAAEKAQRELTLSSTSSKTPA
jgi:hypothetical protein